MNMALLLILILFGMAGAVALTTAAAIACVVLFLKRQPRASVEKPPLAAMGRH